MAKQLEVITVSSTAECQCDREKKHNIWETEERQPLKRLLKSMVQLQPMWDEIFILVCVVAVSLDPLFIYVPIIDEEKKCFTMDKAMKKTSLVLRSFTDLIFIGDIVYNVARAHKALRKEGLWKRDCRSFFWSGLWKRNCRSLISDALAIVRHSWLVILVDILAIVPIPQIVMLVSFPKVRGLDQRKYLNVLLLSQYVPRVFRIYLSCKKLTNTRVKLTKMNLWMKGAFNFFLYVLASHVFGAFWYFYSLQRETSCWHQVCAREIENIGCSNYTFSCSSNKKRETHYIGLLHNSCPTNATGGTSEKPFDFGIFQHVLESGLQGSKDFPQKLAYCFWWGLRNLSSLGQNLNTSRYFWENVFAVSINIFGMLLLLFLIGNLQKYIESATTKAEKIGRKTKSKRLEIERWMSRNGMKNSKDTNKMKEMKGKILDKVEDRLVEDKDVHVDVKNLLALLPPEDNKSFKHHLCFTTLKKVEGFKDMDEATLESIIGHLEPVVYEVDTLIIREGEPLDKVLFVTQGTVWVDHSSSNNHGRTKKTPTTTTTKRLKKGDYYGEKLVEWWKDSLPSFASNAPTSTEIVKSHTKVEAFALSFTDLIKFVQKENFITYQ